MTHPKEPTRLRVRLLGGAYMLGPDGPVEGPASQRHRLALLALLAAAPGSTLSRDKLMALLWPDSDASSARHLLNSSLYELRRVLGASSLRSVGDAVALDGAVDCDLVTFLEHTESGDDGGAVSAYGGRLLDGFHLSGAHEFERWVEQTRQAVDESFRRALEALAQAATARGSVREAAQYWRRLVDHDPYSPRVVLGLMRALDAAQERPAAVSAGLRYGERLARDLDLEPDPEVASLIETLQRAPALPAAIDTGVGIPQSEPPLLSNEPVQAATAAASRRYSGRGVAAAVLLAAGSFALLDRTPTSRPPLALDEDVVAILPFDYDGPPEGGYLSEGVVDLFAARLGGADGNGAVRPRSLMDHTAGPDLDDDDRLQAAIGAGIGAGSRTVLMGSVRLDSAGYSMTARLVDAASGDSESLDPVAGPDSSLLSLVDRLSTDALLRLNREVSGARMDVLRERPLEAIHHYLRGHDAYRRGIWDEAADAFAAALERDSTFAHAGLGLAQAESFAGMTARWERGIETVMRHRDQVSRGEFLVARGMQGRALRIRAETWSEVVQVMPREPMGWYELGDLQYHWGSLLGLPDPTGEARVSFDRALALDSLFGPAMHHLVEVLALEADEDALRFWSEAYFERMPPDERSTTALGWMVARALGDEARLTAARASLSDFRPAELTRISRLTQVLGWPPDDADQATRLLFQKSEQPQTKREALTEQWVLYANVGWWDRADSVAYELLDPSVVDHLGFELAVLSHLYAGGSPALAEDALLRLAAYDTNARDPVAAWSATCVTSWWQTRLGEFGGIPAIADDLIRTVLEERPGSREFGADNEACGLLLHALAAHDESPEPAYGRMHALDTYLSQSAMSRLRSEAANLEVVRMFSENGAPDRALAAARRRQHLQQAPFLLAEQLLARGRLAAEVGALEEAARSYRHYVRLRAPARGASSVLLDEARSELAAVEVQMRVSSDSSGPGRSDPW